MSTLQRLQREHANAQTMAALGLYSQRRPAALRAIGCAIHPAAVTTGWYASDCGAHARLSRRIRMQWALSRLLRGAQRPVSA